MMDCQRCGACCTTERGIDAHVDATPQESVLIPEEMLHKKAAHGLIPLRTKTNKQGVQVCIALDGVVGGRVRCSIYVNRPAMCKELVVPGDEICLLAREEAGVV